MPKPLLDFILHKVDPNGGNAKSNFVLYACRGDGRGCDRNKYRNKGIKCDDCFGPLDDKMTIGEVYDKLKQGDA